MRKLATILLLLSLSLALCAQGIGNAADLKAFIEAANKGESILPWCNADTVVVLTADIDMSKAKKFPQVKSFSGRFDGCGHSLKGWKTAYGLFAELTRKAEVSGIVIDVSCALNAVAKGNAFHAGFIADSNFGVISDCVNYGSLSLKCDYALAEVSLGAIAGFNRFIIKDCVNYGNLSADAAGVVKEDVYLSMGGIAGLCGAKPNTSSLIAHCANHGNISGTTALSSQFVGGITGNANRTAIKYCINKGNITSEVRLTEDGKDTSIGRAAGIAGQTKAHILRCENFGEVRSKGACGSYTAGIVAVPHESLVIAECLNYGKIVSEGEQPSQTGGIAANITRPVHVRGCINWGEIRFEGISSRARSTAAGIVGNIFSPKSQTEGAYVRDCINHGTIFSETGGNKYDAGNRNAIHTAGVVGYAECREGMRAFVKDCSNDGKIVSKGGRKGNIIASSVFVTTCGSAPDVYATVVKASEGSPNVTGSVKTPEGWPVAGIVVTDGRQCVTTDESGCYAMTSDLSEARFIYLSLPATAQIPLRDGVPQFFKRVPRYAEGVQADFVIAEKPVCKDYTLMMIADPQVRPYGWDTSMERWGDTVAPDAEAFRASCDGEVYSINLGDLVYNEMYAWDDYLDIAAKINCPTFNVIGNHDYDQMTLYETEQGNVFYEAYVGPEHFSFDLGDIHYIVVNTIMYDRKTTNDKYGYGLDDRTFAWLQADLSYVPKDKIIVTCSHQNLFKTPNTSPHGSHNFYARHYADYLALLSQYKEVYAWNGHNHENFYYNYANHYGKDTKHGAPNIQCISVARATGALRFNRPIAAKGEPQGYMVVNVRGESLDWYYKGVGQGKDYQMRVYAPEADGDGSVKVNIWNWSEGWSTPEWYEKGVKVADFEFTPGVDPAYYELFQTYDNATNRKYCTPSTKSLIFSVMPSGDSNGGEVRVTDLFGNTYTQSINW